MREIKFRAKSVHAGDWVHGNFIHSKRFSGCGNEFRIHNPDTGLESDVNPGTVGQFTGLKDKNGVEIYEGDILQMYKHDDYTHKHEKSKVWRDSKYNEDIRQVKFSMGTFFTYGMCNIVTSFAHMARPGESFEVIGNIHDNQNLIQ